MFTKGEKIALGIACVEGLIIIGASYIIGKKTKVYLVEEYGTSDIDDVNAVRRARKDHNDNTIMYGENISNEKA